MKPQNDLETIIASVEKLYPVSIEMGLVRVFRLLEKLDNPQKKLKNIVHVAGTNGKGSTLAFLASILRQHGKKVHVYTSPHLVSWAERFYLDIMPWADNNLWHKQDFTEAEKILTQAMQEVLLVNGDDPITLFEFLTCVAFYFFSKYPHDFILLETGLGGRLDATNVIDTPLLTAITSIALDHQEFLGHSLEKIAFEKAGIIKQNIPVVVSSCLNSSALSVLQKIADEKKSSFILANSYQDVPLSLEGRHQHHNAGIAMKIAQIVLKDDFDIDRAKVGLKSAFWPGRLQKMNYFTDSQKFVPLLLDGAHNEEGLESFIQYIKGKSKEDQKRILFFHAKKRKNMWPKIEELFSYFDCIYFMDFAIEGGPHWYFEEAQNSVNISFKDRMTKINSWKQFDETLLLYAVDFVCACGSLFLVGEILKRSFLNQKQSF